VIKDIQLPDHGSHARAIGLRIYPFVLPAELEKMMERGRIVETQSIPHILVVARDAKPVHRVLARMRWILGIGTLLTLGVVFLLIHRAIEVSLDSIDMLTKQVAHRKGHHLDTLLDLPASLPSELTELADNFNQLLSRVAKTRQRESDFILHAAHELRTPIAGLLATTELALAQNRENSEYRNHLEHCRQSAEDLGTLVKRLSALAQSESSDQQIKPTPVDLAEITRKSLKRFSTSFDQRSLRIEESGLSSPHVVTADPALLGIILNNLLDNAACYAPTNSTIAIRCTETPEAIELKWSNDAPNLPDDLDRLFEPLFRQNQARNDSSSHLGIGLTLSRNAAEAMGASLTASRESTNRIEFSLTFPKSS
jgi:two-component system heavy metal sensor histidine kinase CusS